jgi:hypothetical protein
MANRFFFFFFGSLQAIALVGRPMPALAVAMLVAVGALNIEMSGAGTILRIATAVVAAAALLLPVKVAKSGIVLIGALAAGEVAALDAVQALRRDP